MHQALKKYLEFSTTHKSFLVERTTHSKTRNLASAQFRDFWIQCFLKYPELDEVLESNFFNLKEIGSEQCFFQQFNKFHHTEKWRCCCTKDVVPSVLN